MPRSLTLSLGLLVAACCGSPSVAPTDPDPTPEPPTDRAAPPAPIPPANDEEAATPDPLLEEASADVAVFATEDGTCRWSLVQPGSEGQPEPIAVLPLPCHDDVLLGPAPDGPRVAVKMGTATFEVDTASHQVEAVTAVPGLRGDLEAVGYRANGNLVALAADFSEPVTDPDTGLAGYLVEGDRLALDPEEYQYAAGTALCLRYERTADGWRLDAAEAAFLAEGTSPPFCVRDGDGWDVPVVKTRQHGGHGTFDLEPMPEDRQTAALGRFEVNEWVQWGQIQQGGATYAMPFEYLEGQIFMAPLLIWTGDDWRAVEGLARTGDLSLSWGAGTFIACSGDSAGVHATASGARLWSGSTPCPVWWPLAPGG